MMKPPREPAAGQDWVWAHCLLAMALSYQRPWPVFALGQSPWRRAPACARLPSGWRAAARPWRRRWRAGNSSCAARLTWRAAGEAAGTLACPTLGGLGDPFLK